MKQIYQSILTSPALLGYGKLEESLLANFADNKLPHSLLFSGIIGIGKANFAIDLAGKIINQDRINSFANNDPNFLIIGRTIAQNTAISKKNITIDEIRKITDFINLTAAMGKNRVIIIDAIDDLNRNSANALLKILEEPPANIFFFLISHNLGKLPATIKSRCNIIKISPLNYKDFSQAIRCIIPDIAVEKLAMLFTISGGSVAMALDFERFDLIRLYQDFIQQLGRKNININEINVVKDDFSFLILEKIINIFFNRAAKIAVGIDIGDEIFIGEIDLLKNYMAKISLDRIFALSSKVNKLIFDREVLNLDKKQTIVNISNLMSSSC